MALVRPSPGLPITLESAHPYPNNADVYEEVSFPGATEISITFVSECASENNYDFLRFLKARTTPDAYWGLEKYTGSTWPSFVIPADNFVAYFHSDGRWVAVALWWWLGEILQRDPRGSG